MIRFRPVVVSVIAWALGAGTAVAVGLVALSLIGTGLADHAIQPLTSDDVARAAADSGPAGASPPNAASTPSAPAVADRVVSSPGGSAVARCRDSAAYLVYWSPAQGYRTHEIERGPASEVRLTFEGNGREVKISVGCAGDVPVASVHDEVEPDGDG